jgi:hypothetical protein
VTLRSTRTFLLSVFLLIVVSALSASPGQALPLFARKYKVACTTCHMAFPRLNAFGRQFRQNGYRMVGEVGTSPWEDSNVPISFVADVGYDYASTLIPAHSGIPEVRTNTSAFQQNAVELHTAGTLAPHVTFHVDSDFEGVGLALESGMAFVQLDDVARGGGLNVKAGIYDADIPYLAASRTLTAHEYIFPVTLDAVGIELNGTHSGWTYALAMINSERTTGKPSDKTLNNFENPYAWIMRDVHGHELTARVLLDHQDPRAADLRSSSRLEFDLSALLNFSRGTVTPAYAYEKHDEPDVDHPRKRHTGMIEATLLLDSSSRWVLTSRYELQHTPSDGSLLVPERDFYLATADLSYYLNPNARVGLDFARTASNHNDEPRVDEMQAFIHVGY